MFTIGRILGCLGGLSGIAATIIVFTIPLYYASETGVTSSGEVIDRTFRMTLLEAQPTLEPVTVIFFAVMLLASLGAVTVAIFARRGQYRQYGAAVLELGLVLVAGSFISGFSVGPFYMPGAGGVLVGSILMFLGRISSP